MDDPNMNAYGDHYQDTVADILRDVCELEPANPDLPDTVCVSVADLKLILGRHIEAALRDAPQADPRCAGCDIANGCPEFCRCSPQQAEGWVMVPVEPTPAMLVAMWDHREAMRGQSENRIARAGYAAMLSARPSAPTAVEPPELSMSMFASVADFEAAKRRAAVEPDERAEFEAWAGPITALAKENGKYVEVMTSLAWEAWQARASKGTPL